MIMLTYKVRNTSSNRYSLDEYENWEFKETIASWFVFMDTTEEELQEFVDKKIKEWIKRESIFDEIKKLNDEIADFFENFELDLESDWCETLILEKEDESGKYLYVENWLDYKEHFNLNDDQVRFTTNDWDLYEWNFLVNVNCDIVWKRWETEKYHKFEFFPLYDISQCQEIKRELFSNWVYAHSIKSNSWKNFLEKHKEELSSCKKLYNKCFLCIEKFKNDYYANDPKDLIADQWRNFFIEFFNDEYKDSNTYRKNCVIFWSQTKIVFEDYF